MKNEKKTFLPPPPLPLKGPPEIASPIHKKSWKIESFIRITIKSSVFVQNSKCLNQIAWKTKNFQNISKKMFWLGPKLVKKSPKLKILGQNSLIFEFWAYFDAYGWRTGSKFVQMEFFLPTRRSP